jgi:hypothetical protein
MAQGNRRVAHAIVRTPCQSMPVIGHVDTKGVYGVTSGPYSFAARMVRAGVSVLDTLDC